MTLIEEFLVSLRIRGRSERTILSYLGDLKSLFGKDVETRQSLDPSLALSVLGSDSFQRLAPATRRRRVSTLRVFGRFLASRGQPNPFEDLTLPRAHPTIPRVPDRYQVNAMIKATKAPDELLLVLLLYGSGLRVSEALGVRMPDVRGDLLVVRGKGSKERQVPLLPGALLLLGSGVTLESRSRSWAYRVTQRLGGVSPHSLRHAIATHLLQSGVDLMSLKEFLGHQSIATTQHYLHLEMGRLLSQWEACQASFLGAGLPMYSDQESTDHDQGNVVSLRQYRASVRSQGGSGNGT